MYLVELKESDLELVSAWRNNPSIYKYSLTQNKKVTWEHHYKWYKNLENAIYFIIMYDNRKIGIVNVINLNSNCPELGIYIGEITLWGKGLGKEAVGLIINNLQRMDYKKVCVTTNKNNIRSINLWVNLGFKKIGSVKENKEWFFERDIT